MFSKEQIPNTFDIIKPVGIIIVSLVFIYIVQINLTLLDLSTHYLNVVV